MITKKQIEKYCKRNKGLRFSKLLFAVLDRDHQIEYGDYTAPANTIIRVRVYLTAPADLYIDSRCVTTDFPYDAATLLEDE